MALDPEARAVLDATAALGLPPMEEGTPEVARAAMIERRKLVAGEPRPVASIVDRLIPGPVGDIAVRVYRPRPGALPALVFFHGGGWVIGTIDTHDPICRDLAVLGDCAVISVGYRLAPESRFPAAADDAFAATRWTIDNADELGIDAGRVSVGGDSAGGNLAAAVALMARDRGYLDLKYQLLIYPVTDHGFDTPSYLANAEGYGLTRAQMIWFSNHYLANAGDATHPYAAPLRAPSLAGLPSAYVVTAGYDVLRDEAISFVERLRADRVAVEHVHYDGLIHGFFGMGAAIRVANAAVQDAARALGAALRA
ncbi:MAG: alpha/beta hydrolase [Chloroflexota bacterium]|nr:MAG: alpha/beta hydrolase [Chloroflexota bacterium]